MKIVFLGNFDFPFSTESHHKWTWEKMGHTVIPLQENRTSTDAVIEACKNADVLQYTHTHSWHTIGSIPIQSMLDRIHQMGVKTFSYHLDLYWGLNLLDRRQDRIGEHPSWKVQYFFSTDGGHEKEYRERGVNHHYLPPAVVEYGVYKGQYTPALASDIGFVGSIGYHPEYPWRTKMVEALQKQYGPQFRVYNGFREASLNNVYASCKIIVGDHCHAGIPRYWSDRLPETCGRGGFIIYPRTEGMTIPTATYEPQNITDLFNKIAHYINNPQERDQIRDAAFEYVKAHDTYTHRLNTILQIMGF